MIGPWVHGSQNSRVAGEVEFTPEAGIDLLAFRLRWFDRWLRLDKNDVDLDPPVLLYIMGTGDDRRSPAGRLRHGGFWRAEHEWPLERTLPTTFYLTAEGSLANDPPSIAQSHTTYTYDPKHPVPTVGGNISSNQGLMQSGGYDQRGRADTHAALNELPLSERRDVLVFRTPPLASDLEVTGTTLVKLWVASTAPDTDFTAKLIDEIPPNPDYPLGFDLNLGDSIFRADIEVGSTTRQVRWRPATSCRSRLPCIPMPTSSRRGIAFVSTSPAAIIRGSTSIRIRAIRSATTAAWSPPTTPSITTRRIHRR